jgi:hypothetical protein
METGCEAQAVLSYSRKRLLVRSKGGGGVDLMVMMDGDVGWCWRWRTKSTEVVVAICIKGRSEFLGLYYPLQNMQGAELVER